MNLFRKLLHFKIFSQLWVEIQNSRTHHHYYTLKIRKSKISLFTFSQQLIKKNLEESKQKSEKWENFFKFHLSALSLAIYGGGWTWCSIASISSGSKQLDMIEVPLNGEQFHQICPHLNSPSLRLLRNGSCVKFVNAKDKLCDYNLLPPENSKFFVKEILAEDSGISHIGFPHIRGCEKLDKIVLNNCSYIEDEALKWLSLRKDSLKHLEVINCKNITDEGLRSLKALKLEKLIAKNLPYVKDVDGVREELVKAMPGCVIEIEKW